MLTKKKSFWGIIILYFMVLLILMLVPNLFITLVPVRFMQLLSDSIIVILGFSLNKRFWHIRISFFSTNSFFRQLLLSLPAIVLLLVTKLNNWLNISISKVTFGILLTVIMIAMAEEVIFRGLLIPLGMVCTGGRPFLTIMLSSLMFGLIHLVNLAHTSVNMVLLQIVLVFASGMLWGGIYLRTHNLLITIILHFLDDFPDLVVNTNNTSITTFSSSQVQLMYLVVIGLALLTCLIVFLQVHRFSLRRCV